MNSRQPVRAAMMSLFAGVVFLTAPLMTVAQSPNVVFIVADDAGYADFGFMNGLSGETSEIPTPNLDALAARGVTFSRAYVAPSCQPTRAALVTGGYQNRIGNEVVGNNLTSANGVFEGVPLETKTIWDRMKSVGYTTGAVGKWHLGEIENTPTQLGNRPQNQGVDEFYGIWHGSRGYSVGNVNGQTQTLREAIVLSDGTITDNSVESAHAGEYITNTFGQYGVDFIANHHDDTNPFFLYQSFTAPHTPLQNSPDFNDPSLSHLSGTRKTYGSMMLTMDKEIGRIVDRLEDPNGDGNTSDSIADNTMVVFINDNGGADSGSSSPNSADNGQFRRGKGTPWEGGIRVPMIVAGAGINAAKEGTTYNEPVHGIDIVPTAFTAGGGTFGAGDTAIDGVDLLPYINGTNTGVPHDVLVHRHRTQFAVVKGNMKLVWSGGSPSANHHLYNLANDIGETTNIAGANAAIVAEMQRDLTDHEAVFDKQRYAILGQTAEATINTFDHFTFKPNGSGAGTGDSVILDGSVGNGDFNAGGGTGPTADAQTYAETANWFNASGSETLNFTNLSQMGGSSQAQSRGGMPFNNRVQVNESGHTITAAGEVFSLSYDFGAGGGLANWDGDELMRTFLFTTNATVGANLVEGDITELATDSYAVDRAGDGQWTSHSSNSFYVSKAADIGKTVYFGMEFQDPNVVSNLFPRIDVVTLTAAGGAGGTGAVQTTNWSSSGAWFEGGTTAVETMFHSDSFAGAVLEFPTVDDFSYVSNNDMVRSTGLEFMLNKMELSGGFAGTEDKYATIQGNAVLFTKSLDGVGPQIAVDAMRSGASDYDYNIDLDVVMYDDLTITGNGDVGVTINGSIRDYHDPRNLIKDGSSKVVLAGSNTYSGSTTVAGGTLAMTGTSALNNTTGVEIQSGASFDVSGRNGGGLTFQSGQSLSGSGNVVGNVIMASGASLQPGSGLGELTIAGNVTLSAGSALDLEIGGASAAGTDYDQLDVGGSFQLQGGTLNVSFANGFIPASGDTFDVIDFASLTGSFDTLNLPGLAGGMTWDTSSLLSTGVLAVSGGAVACDADGDKDCQLDDFDAMYQAEGMAGAFDFDGDQTVGPGDIPGWLAAASTSANLANPLGKTISDGDLNLDFSVDSADLGRLLNNFGADAGTAASGPGWGGGDVNMDGSVDSADLGRLLNKFGFVGAAASAAVPEPSSNWLLLMGIFAAIGGSARRR